MTIKKRKLKQWWSKTPSISTKRKITSDLNSLNTEKKGGNVGNGGQNRYLNKR
jgi:hypothetical protein